MCSANGVYTIGLNQLFDVQYVENVPPLDHIAENMIIM